MNRRQFTEANARFNLELIEKFGEHPVDDYLLRSAVEQARLFKAGLSKCDGVTKISAHQKGLAVDKYLTALSRDLKTVTILFSWPMDKARKYHDIWEKKYGGKKMIEWDPGHFEG